MLYATHSGYPTQNRTIYEFEPMNYSLFIRNTQDNSIHEVRKYIKDPQGVISVWANTWYGRHVIGQDCEIVSEVDMMNVHSFLHATS